MARLAILGRTARSLQIGILVGLVAGAVALLRDWSRETLSGQASVIDGDSLRLNGTEIRLKGIDAPEYRQTCRRAGREEPCGHESRQVLVGLVQSGPLACTLYGQDRYRRTLAVCRAGDLEVNREMVRTGHAVAYGDYEREEREARSVLRGIWATTFEPPADWRARHARPAE